MKPGGLEPWIPSFGGLNGENRRESGMGVGSTQQDTSGYSVLSFFLISFLLDITPFTVSTRIPKVTGLMSSQIMHECSQGQCHRYLYLYGQVVWPRLCLSIDPFTIISSFLFSDWRSRTSLWEQRPQMIPSGSGQRTEFATRQPSWIQPTAVFCLAAEDWRTFFYSCQNLTLKF